VQLAAAYATFANGGKLIEPALVKEIVAPDGSIRYRHTPRVVRQVMPTAVADHVRHMLLDVVDDGTALQAALDNYLLAGKTGTPRSTVRGHYVAGRYNPNFVGLFPGDAPQYVIVVKLTAPQSSIFAAKTAAPVTKAILQAAIAARDAALDRGKLASSISAAHADSLHRDVAQAGDPNGVADRQVDTAGISRDTIPHRPSTAPYVITLPARVGGPPVRAPRAVPDVRGLDLRDAVRSLHSAGFRVQLARDRRLGDVVEAAALTEPAAGEMAQTGTLVRLLIDY
jgi:membrane peptidoglycan carboxypeptidase